MEWQIQLIGFYVIISNIWKKELGGLNIRRSNNSKPVFTDEEVMAVYLYGHMTGRTELKEIHEFTKNHLSEWFPLLPSYEAFCYRTHRLERALIVLCEKLCLFCHEEWSLENKWLLDSMPIALATGSRSFNAKVARGIATKGYCASKKMHYYGIKLHVVANRVAGSIPSPHLIMISGASVHDLTAFKLFASDLRDGILLCDKAYCDKAFKKKCKDEQNLKLFTPIKKPKNSELTSEQKNFSTLVSKYRQPIESFFNWLHQATGIQIASKVRSGKGLAIHVFGKLAAALFLRVLPNP